MAFTAYLSACAAEIFDGSNTAVIAYLDAVDRKDAVRTAIEHSNCIVVHRSNSLYTSGKLACKMYNDGVFLKNCGVKYFPAVMNAIGRFVNKGWLMICAAVNDPKQFNYLLDDLMAQLSSVSSNISQAMDATYDRLLEFINSLVKKYNCSAGLNTAFSFVMRYIKQNWSALAQSFSSFVCETVRIHFYKYVFQITAVITELHEILASMAWQMPSTKSGLSGEFLIVLSRQ